MVVELRKSDEEVEIGEEVEGKDLGFMHAADLGDYV